MALGTGESLVKKTLMDQGYADSDIGWDAARKMVTLKGKDFLTPTKVVNQRSVANNADITNALSRYRDNETRQEIHNMLGQMKSTMDTPYQAPQFNYDANSDPVYQGALRRAQANAATAGGNAQAEMNRRGILNSTITGDRVAQIQQAEMGRVSDTILPQLIEQAYSRHRDTVGDQYRQNRDKLKDLYDILNTTRDGQRYDRDVFVQDRDYDRLVGRDERDDFVDDRNYNRDVFTSDRNYNRDKLVTDRDYNRGVLESDRDYNRGVLEADRSHNASVAKRSQGSSSNASSSKSVKATPTYDQKKMAGEKQGLVTALRGGDVLPQDALKQIDEDEAYGLYTKEEADDLRTVIAVYQSNNTQTSPVQNTPTTKAPPIDPRISRYLK